MTTTLTIATIAIAITSLIAIVYGLDATFWGDPKYYHIFFIVIGTVYWVISSSILIHAIVSILQN